MHHEGNLTSSHLQVWHVLFIVNEIALVHQVTICFPIKKSPEVALSQNDR